MLSATIPYRSVLRRLTSSLGEIWTVLARGSHPPDSSVAKSERNSDCPNGPSFATCHGARARSELASSTRVEGRLIFATPCRVGRPTGTAFLSSLDDDQEILGSPRRFRRNVSRAQSDRCQRSARLRSLCRA